MDVHLGGANAAEFVVDYFNSASSVTFDYSGPGTSSPLWIGVISEQDALAMPTVTFNAATNTPQALMLALTSGDQWIPSLIAQVMNVSVINGVAEIATHDGESFGGMQGDS